MEISVLHDEYGWGDDQKTFLVVQVIGRWSVANYDRVATELFEMMSEVTYPVDLIVDMRYSSPPPTQIIEIAGRLMRQRPDNHRYTIVISGQGLWRKLVNTVINIFDPLRDRRQIVFVSSVDEAYQFIAQSQV